MRRLANRDHLVLHGCRRHGGFAKSPGLLNWQCSRGLHGHLLQPAGIATVKHHFLAVTKGAIRSVASGSGTSVD